MDNAVSGFGGWAGDGPGARQVEAATTILRKRVDPALLGEGVVTLADGRRVVVSGGPLHVAGLKWQMTSWMDAGEALAPVEPMRSELRLWGFLVALLMAATGVAISSVMVRPLRELVGAARRLVSGHLDTRVEVRSRDELGLLPAQFNSMASSLKRQSNELQNILPGPIAMRLKSGEQRIADAFPR